MMLLFFFISLIVPLASVNKASALTPQQLQDCYFYNGKTVGSLVSSTSSGNTTAPNYTFQECQDMGACQKPASNTATISCTNPTQQQAVDTKLGSAITTICGPNNAIGAAYNNCVNDVTNAYNACKNASTSTAAVDGTKEQAIAACIAGKVAGVNVAKLGTALTGSAAAAATLYASEQSCVQANGQWDAAAGTCTGAAQETPTCEGSGFAMDWIFCPLYEGLSSVTSWIMEHLILPQLKMSPLCLSGGEEGCVKNDPIYKIWSSFRIYGNIILVIALLVVVFGEVIGGGVIEAYTVKKVLPRLLAGAILINLSIYLVGIMVDITNIIGGGIGSLITQPLQDAGAWSITTGGVKANASVFGIAAGAGILGASSVAGLFSVAGMAMILDVILIPVFFVFIAILAIVAIRKALIIALVLVAPVAFALYCLPNTEKYFKKWWELLFETLMVYPIIVLFFALSSVMSVIIETPQAGAESATAGINAILSLVFTVLPLFLIVFAFKIAGGTFGKLMGAVDGIRTKAHGYGQSRRERSMGNFKDKNIQKRQDRSAWLNDQASRGGGLRRSTLGRALKTASRTYGGYNIEAEASAARAAKMKLLNDQIATGNDADIRGLTVDKNWALSNDRNGGNLWRMEGGKRQFKSLGGAWIDEANVDAGHRRWGGDNFAQQAALGYEMRKVNTEEQAQGLARNYNALAKGAWGMTDQEAGGAWIGAAFEHQNSHLEYKYTSWKTGRMSAEKHDGFVDEIYEKRGSYNMAQMGSNTLEQLKESYRHADAVIRSDPTATADQIAAAQDRKEKIAAIAESFMSEYGGGGQIGTVGDDGKQPQMAQGAATGRRQSNTPGAAHTAERVRELAELTGVYSSGPTGLYTDGDHTPTPNRREQH